MSEEEIITRLKRIEKKLDSASSRSKRQTVKAVGLTLCIAAVGLVYLNIWIAVFVFVGGFIMYNYPSSKISEL